jgi:hypothetical protein
MTKSSQLNFNAFSFCFRKLILLTIVGGLLTSCAYRLGSSERSLPGGAKLIAVPVFKNKTMEPGIEVAFTNALIQEFERSGVAKVSPLSMAEVRAEGHIESISYVPSGKRTSADLPLLPTGAVLATEYRILVKAFVTILRNHDNKILWSGEFNGERTYSAPQVASATINTVNPLYNLSARRQNIETLSVNMMAEAHDRLTENF